MQKLLRRYREYDNQPRSHQSLNQATLQTAWDLLEHIPATEAIPLVALEAKTAEYLQKRRLGRAAANGGDIVVSKTEEAFTEFEQQDEAGSARRSSELLVAVTRDNCQAYCKRYQVSLPVTSVQSKFVRMITAEEFVWSDPDTAEVLLSFPLTMVALRVHGRFVALYSIQGIQATHPTKQWSRKAAEYQRLFEAKKEQMPEVLDYK